jgi:hypothetical protein
MKKISFIAVALSMGFFVSAQQPQLRTEMERTTRLGVKAGANFATMDINDAPGITSNKKTSLQGGLVLNIPVGMGGMAVQPELLYNGMGGKLTESSTLGGTQRYEQDLHYISLPIMLQWKSPSGLYFELGPQASYLLKATQDNGTTDVSNKDRFDKFDIAASGGVGFMSRIGLGVGARYNYGLSNTLEDNGTNSTSELKNRVISVGLTYLFGAYK